MAAIPAAAGGLGKPRKKRLSIAPLVLKRANRKAAETVYRKAANQPSRPQSGPYSESLSTPH